MYVIGEQGLLLRKFVQRNKYLNRSGPQKNNTYLSTYFEGVMINYFLINLPLAINAPQGRRKA